MVLGDAFQVSRYEIMLEVWPIPARRIPVRHGSKEREVQCDNVARLNRKLLFSETNACREPFTLRYATRGDGFISPPEVIPVHLNEASPADLGRYADQGKEVTLRFTPGPGMTCFMGFEVYKGFDPGERNAHFHLHPKTRYESILVTLDLRSYLEQGYPVSHGPDLYFHRDDPQDHDLCKVRGLGSVVKPTRAERGRWTWEMSMASEGVIDLIWDVDGPENLRHKADPEAQRVEELVRSRLTACRVFDHIMKVIAQRGPVSFRKIEAASHGILPASGPGSVLPLSQSQISKLIPLVEEMLEDPAFFGSPVRLFPAHPGRGAEPGEKAQKALAMLRPYLEKLAGE
jgi:hypothetical protein